jgi:hypothetical protein
MDGTRYLAITHLHVDLAHLSLELILTICIALKPTLNLLSLCDYSRRTKVELLLPIYESLQERIQGLYVWSTSHFTPILNLSFPKLRMLAIDDSFQSIDSWLNQDVRAPIEMIAVHYRFIDAYPNYFPVDTFSKFPRLKRIVFMRCYRADDDLAAHRFFAVCETLNIKCIYVDGW